MEEAHGGRLKTLRDKLKDLEKQEREILDEIDKWEEVDVTSPTLEDMIVEELEKANNPMTVTEEDMFVAFVEEIEEAHLYFEYRKYLLQNEKHIKHDSDGFDIFIDLVQQHRVPEMYKKLDIQTIWEAVNGCISDLRSERRGKDNMSTSSEEYDLGGFGFNAGGNPIVGLVYEMRKERYIMDKKPLVELAKAKKYNPIFFKEYFIWSHLQKFSATKVVVDNLPRHYTDEDVKAAFWVCGEIECVKMEGDMWRNVAYVTFKDPIGAKIAPILVNKTPTPMMVEPFLEATIYQPKDESEYTKALNKYQELRNYYYKKNLNKRSNEDICLGDKRIRQENPTIMNGGDQTMCCSHDLSDICL